ncbi:MAG: hypothetical protein AAF988_01655 [Pseudomonadota bacterium]
MPEDLRIPYKAANGAPKRKSANPVRDAFIHFQETGEVTREDVERFKRKYFQLSQGKLENTNRNWEIFYRYRLSKRREKQASMAAEFGFSNDSNVANILDIVSDFLLQDDPLMPSDEYLLFIHRKYLEDQPPYKEGVDKKWDIWLRLNAQSPRCKTETVARVYDVTSGAISHMNRKMKDLILNIMKQYPEDEFEAARQARCKDDRTAAP